MEKIDRKTVIVFVLIFVCFGFIELTYANEQALGRQAEQAGKLRQALNHYVAALQSATEGSSKDLELREKVIRLAQKIQPSPEVPEEAERYFARGEAAVETALDKQGYVRAADEFRKVLNIAPWVANGYFNLGVVLDKAGKYDEAINNLNFYLITVPDSRDAKKLIYKIKYKKEEAARVKAEEKEKITKEESRKNILQALVGVWRWFLGNRGYNSDVYELIHIEGNEIIMASHASSQGERFKGGRMVKIRPGDKIRDRRYQLGGLDGLTLLDKDGKIAGKVNKNLKEIKIYLRLPGKPDYDYIYHKCRTLSVDSCGAR